jgi:hypothetical protein
VGDRTRLIVALALVLVITSITDGKEVDAKKVMDAIQRGVPVNFDGYIVKGDLNLSGSLENYKHISASININNSIINGNVYFRDTIFYKQVIFSGSRINGIANFSGSQFNGIADFSKAKFNNISYFDSASFKQEAYFNNSTFNGTTDFSWSQFNGIADFSKAKFNNISYFNSAYFQGETYFSNSTFNGTTDFGGSQFNGTAYFSKAKFNNISYFNSANFQQETYFNNSTFNGAAYFNMSQFHGDAYFGYYYDIHSGSKFKGPAYFEFAKFSYASFMRSNFGGKADFKQSEFNDYIDFAETQFQKTTSFDWATFKKQAFFTNSTFVGNSDFYGSQFESDAMFDGAKFIRNLTLNWTRYSKLYIRWNNIEKLTYDDAAYLSLIKNFRDLGYFEDADNCYYRFRVEQFKHKNFSCIFPSWVVDYLEQCQNVIVLVFPVFIDFMARIFYGYGVEPLYPLMWSIVSIFLFGFIWMIGGINAPKDNRGIFERYGPNQMVCHKNRPSGRDWWSEIHALGDALIFSVVVFLSGTKLFIDPPEIPELQRLSRSLAKIVFTAERVLGAFFFILLFIAIGATVVRQIS